MSKQLLDAAYENDVEKIKSLLDIGVDINSEDEDKVTALYEAVSKKNYNAVELLLQKGADSTKEYYRDRYSVLHMAVGANDKKMVELLLRYMNDVNGRDRFGNPPLWTAIHQASLDRNASNPDVIEIVEMLLKKGADPYTPNRVGQMLVGKRKEPVGESLSPYDSAVRNKRPNILALIEKYVPKPA